MTNQPGDSAPSDHPPSDHPPLDPYGQQSPYGAQPPYGQQPPGYGGYGNYPHYPVVPSTDGNAIAALVLSIASFVICPVITAVLALVFANTAERTIQESGGWKGGQGLVTTARIVAWINIGLAVLAVIGIMIALVGVRSSSG